jgi:KaiC/GvpD/RAD55 family RecA-like ATPase
MGGETILADNAYLTSVAPQTVIASPGQNLSFAVSYQVWQPEPELSYCAATPCPYLLFFLGSWSPKSVNFYLPVYSGKLPPSSPGKTGAATFHVTAPVEGGTYYLWFMFAGGLGDIPTNPGSPGSPGNPSFFTSIVQLLAPRPGHIKIVVTGVPTTVTVVSKIASAASPPLSIPLVPVGLVGVAVVVIGSVVVVERKRGKLRIGRRHVTPSITLAKVVQQKPTLSTGYPDLDGTLAGGIPEGYAVVLVSPSYDERDLLLRRIIDSALSSGRPAFYISSDIERSQDLLARYQSGFYAFSPQADKIQPKPPNLYQLPSIDNLSDHTLSLSLAIRDARAKETGGKMLLVLDTLSNIVLRYKGLTTTRWLTDFVGKRKAEGFTIVATLNPLSISKEEVQAVVDLFDGVIEIFEKELKERARRFVVVKKMYGKKYSESELMLDKDKLF